MTTPGGGAGGESRHGDDGLDARRYDDLGYDGRRFDEPGYTDPSYVDPNHVDPAQGAAGYTDPAQAAPGGYADPGYADPGYVDPGYAGQGVAGQGYADPSYADPGYPDQRHADQRYADPGYADPGYSGQGYAENTTPGQGLPAQGHPGEAAARQPGPSRPAGAGYASGRPDDPSGTYEQRWQRAPGGQPGQRPAAGDPQDVGVQGLLTNSEPHGGGPRRPRRGWRAGADPRRTGTPTEPRPAPGAEPSATSTRPVPGPESPPTGPGAFGRVGQGVGQRVGWMRDRAAGGVTALRARRSETPAQSRRRSAAPDQAAVRALPLAVGMFTVIPLPATRTAQDPAEPGLGAWALRWLPLLGALLGLVAWALSLVFWRGHDGGAAFLGAVVWVAVLALLSRGLHLDGLADVADGLGSRRPAAEALAIMRQSDIGPFGVAAAVGVVLLQVAAVATLLGGASRAQGLVLLVVAVVAGRLAALDAARPSVPAARPGGFGAVVAGTAGTAVSAIAIGVTLVVGWLLLALTATSLVAALWLPFAVLVGLAAGRLVTWHVVRRLDGITGDVFGAVIEITTTVTLLALAAVVAWNGLL